MGMFSNYNEHDYFIPNNTNCSFPLGQSYTKLSNDKACLPYCEYNSKGECIGYYWYYGESMNLDFDIEGELTTDDGHGTGRFIQVDHYMYNKTVLITLYNFRHEKIFTKSFPGCTKIILPIDGDLAKALVRGVYYCSMEVVGDNMRETIFCENDCVLMVK